jgi:hypothetical protein
VKPIINFERKSFGLINRREICEIKEGKKAFNKTKG